MKYTKDCLRQINRLKTVLETADAVIIGAGAGLSTSAGFTYSGERFHKYFADFEEKYGFQDMYSGGFFPFSTPEEYWGYWSRYVFINRYQAPEKPVYDKLLELVKNKEYFVITTNVDHCFQKVGFDKKRLFYMQGDYGLFQCSEPCHNKTYDNESLVLRMTQEQKEGKIPSHLLPFCPICGKTMTMNLRIDEKFVQDEGWYEACERYEKFLHKYKNARVLYLELGVGSNTPVIIKYPFWRLTAKNEKATYACINKGDVFCPPEIENRSICINNDIGLVLDELDVMG